MASLSQVTLETRVVFKWLAIIFGGLLIIFFVLKVKDILFPPPPPPPTVSFGKLPPVDFPSSVSDRTFTYSIDTISGNLPNFGTSQRVFKIAQDQPDLLSLTRAGEKARSIGFVDKPNQVSENVYQWDKDGKTLTMNILNFNFNLSSNFLFRKNSINFKNTEPAIEASKNILQNMELLPKDLDNSKTKTDFLLVKDFKLFPAPKISDAQLIRVSLFQKDFNGLPIFYPNSSVSPMNFIIGKDSEVLEANFFYQKVSDESATYPIKSTKEAFDELKKGQAYISINSPDSNVKVKKVFLGYFFSEKKQSFLMPVILFEGDGFEAFVSAIRNEWVDRQYSPK